MRDKVRSTHKCTRRSRGALSRQCAPRDAVGGIAPIQSDATPVVLRGCSTRFGSYERRALKSYSLEQPPLSIHSIRSRHAPTPPPPPISHASHSQAYTRTGPTLARSVQTCHNSTRQMYARATQLDRELSRGQMHKLHTPIHTRDHPLWPPRSVPHVPRAHSHTCVVRSNAHTGAWTARRAHSPRICAYCPFCAVFH